MEREKVYEGGKSFFVYSNNRNHCYNCGYCILESVNYLKEKNKFRDIEIGAPPADLHPMLKKIPVAVNNSYGDPGLQWGDTLSKLEKLEEANHRGPVAIITKSEITERITEKVASLNLSTVFLTSISKLPNEIEKVDYEKRLHGIENVVKYGIPLVTYFRPIIPGFNDMDEVIESIMNNLSQRGAETLVYSGLMGKERVIEKLESRVGDKIPPPEGYDEWQEYHKLVSSGTREKIEKEAGKNGLEVFRKTSCGVTNALNREHDYNMHFSKPTKYGCRGCVNLEKCTAYASKDKEDQVRRVMNELDLEGNLIYESQEQECTLEDVCQENCTSCANSQGDILELAGKHTQGFISIVRWLTGVSVTAEKVVKSHRIPEKEIRQIKNARKDKIMEAGQCYAR